MAESNREAQNDWAEDINPWARPDGYARQPQRGALRVERMDDHDLPAPAYETDGAAALDLRACIDGPMVLDPGDCELIPTGFAFGLPPGTALMLLPRSGLGHKHGIVLGNGVGLIDEDYRGEVMVSVWNRGNEVYWHVEAERAEPSHAATIINPGDRIAQAVLVPILRPEIVEVDELDETARGAGGFGSTGT